MIATGSRRYTTDPTLLEMLTVHVTDLAGQSIVRTTRPTYTIAALLILCTWPLPANGTYDDPSPVYAGVIMQLALQNGLHTFSKRQDFSDAQIDKDISEELYRVRLWVHCKMVCHL